MLKVYSTVCVFSFSLILSCTATKSLPLTNAGSVKRSIIYCTDLFHPPDDPDDHFDIVSFLSMPEIDIKCVILDQGKKQERKTGAFVLEQLAYLTGRRLPSATGLYSPLKTVDDNGLDQPSHYQGGVELILKTLREAIEPIEFVIVGSTRDVAAAYNREPELFKKKSNQIHIFSGQATEGHPEEEYNVKLDVHGFTRIMNSGLPITWNPCIDAGQYTNNGRSSFFNATHTDLLARSSENLKKFFLYMLERQEDKDYQTYLRAPLRQPSADTIFPKKRALWGTSVFGYISGRKVIQRGQEFYTVPAMANLKEGDVEVRPFHHEKVSARFDEKGKVIYGEGQGFHPMLQIRVPDPLQYRSIMTSAAANLLHDFDQVPMYASEN